MTHINKGILGDLDTQDFWDRVSRDYIDAIARCDTIHWDRHYFGRFEIKEDMYMDKKTWLDELVDILSDKTGDIYDERAKERFEHEIKHALNYTAEHNHGTSGHLALNTIAALHWLAQRYIRKVEPLYETLNARDAEIVELKKQLKD